MHELPPVVRVSGYPHHATGPFAVPCQSCHEKEGEDWARSIHARNAVTVGSAPTCATCHGTHHVLGPDDPRSPIYPLNVAALCGGCHANPKIIGTYFGAADQAQARTAVANYYKTVHGTAMTKAGLVVAATCSNCHGAHLILPPDSAASTINRANIASTCGACHVGVLETFGSSSHGQALLSGAKTPTGHSAPVCIDCHPAHHLVSASDPVWFRGVVQECGSCHEQQYKTYFETYHGQVTELGFGLTAKCSDCHTAHDMLPATDPKSSVYPTNLVKTCSPVPPDRQRELRPVSAARRPAQPARVSAAVLDLAVHDLPAGERVPVLRIAHAALAGVGSRSTGCAAGPRMHAEPRVSRRGEARRRSKP